MTPYSKKIIVLVLVCAFVVLEVIFIKARTAWYDGLPTPIEAEAWELKETIIWFGEMRMSSLLLKVTQNWRN